MDIVALDGVTLVFAEVKTRASTCCGGPLDAMTPAKCRRIAAMAADYQLRRRLHTRGCRFDVVAVTFDEEGRAAVQVVPNAFDGW